jgi:transketolase
MTWTRESSDRKSSFRGAYTETLTELITLDARIMVLEADLMKSSATDGVFKAYPNHCINFGISEANMISAAGGMSKAGLLPFAHSFAPFATRRALDQIYMSVAYSRNNLFLYGSDAGIWSQRNGGTHTANEDVAVMRSIPACQVFDPSDPIQFRWLMRHYREQPGFYYVRGSRKNDIRHLYTSDSTFEVGKGVVLHHGSKVAIVASGLMVHEALNAADHLRSYGIDPTVVDFFSLKPYDAELCQQLFATHEVIVVTENASAIGGLGSLVALELARSEHHPRYRHLAIPDAFGEVGSLEFLKAKFKLRAEDIVEETLSALHLKEIS